MKSRRITESNHSQNLQTSADSAIVRGKFWNELKDDLDALNPSDNVVNATNINEAVPGQGVTVQLSTNVVEKTIEVLLSAVQLCAMQVTPVAVVAAPGAAYALSFVRATLIYDSTGTAYANGGVITINYASAGAAQSAALAATFLTGAGDKVFNLEKLNAANGLTMPVNVGLTITNAAAPFITGTGVCRLQITYTVHTTGL